MASGDHPDTSPDPSDGSASPSRSMDKPTKGKATSSPTGTKKRMTAKEQREAFIQTARELGADESEGVLEAVLERMDLATREDSKTLDRGTDREGSKGPRR